ncbi:hypothetical protein K8942_03680 [Candidatus Peribacteria bacterium]|nr:MAG: hypothetical protein K8942_03680 [Candidatus Peribacteria bacterium]
MSDIDESDLMIDELEQAMKAADNCGGLCAHWLDRWNICRTMNIALICYSVVVTLPRFTKTGYPMGAPGSMFVVLSRSV